MPTNVSQTAENALPTELHEDFIRLLKEEQPLDAWEKAQEIVQHCEAHSGLLHPHTLKWLKALSSDFLAHGCYRFSMDFALRGKRRARELFFETHPVTLEFTFLTARALDGEQLQEEAQSLFVWIAQQLLEQTSYPQSHHEFVREFLHCTDKSLPISLLRAVSQWASTQGLLDKETSVKFRFKEIEDVLRGPSEERAQQAVAECCAQLDSLDWQQGEALFLELRELGRVSEHRGAFELLLKWGLDTLQTHDKHQGPLALDLHLDLCHFYLEIDEAELAYAAFNSAVTVLNRLHSNGEENLSGTSKTLGEIAYAFGKIEESRQLLTKALHELIKGNPESPETAETLHNLGTLLVAQGELGEARPYLEYAVSLRRKFDKADSPDLARSLHALGKLEMIGGTLENAHKALVEAKEIFEQNGSISGELKRDLDEVERGLSKSTPTAPSETEVIELQEVALEPPRISGGLKTSRKLSGEKPVAATSQNTDALRSALLLIQRGKNEDAITTLEELLEEDKVDTSRRLLILENLMVAYENVGDEAGRKHCRNLIETLG